MIPARRVGPGQALWARGVDASTPAAFCSALLTNIRYVLPEDVPPATWQAALRHFAERQMPEATFRRLLEQRAARDNAANRTPVSVDAGARVAAYLLREWEQYQLARRLTPGGPRRRPGARSGAPGRRSAGRSRSRDRAASAALLQRLGVPMTLITDSMAGHFMSRGKVDLVIVGADRIAANGDVANKIGTYSLAVLARENGIPFYVAAPTSTVDLSLNSGIEIPIEERSSREVTDMAGSRIAPEGVNAAHPAFDVTPARLVTAIITEYGVLRPPYAAALTAAVRGFSVPTVAA